VLKRLVAEPKRLLKALIIVPWAALRYLIHKDRGALKAQLIYLAFSGLTYAQATQLAHAYVESLTAADFNTDVLNRLHAHQARADETVLMSASVDLYVPLIAKRLHMNHCICTELRWQDDAITATLGSANVRGRVKRDWFLNHLKAKWPDHRFYAYGNAASDLDHLVCADEGFLVHANAKDNRLAMGLKVHIGLPNDGDVEF
jgi:phosphoserine phosphatase